MRRPALFLSLLLVLGQIALGLHQIEHRFEPAALDQTPCGLCAVADHMDGAQLQVATLPSGTWVAASFHIFLDQPPRIVRRGGNLARAPPVSVA